MKSFDIACWNTLVAVRLISVSRAQKGLFLLSRLNVRRVHENFSSPLLEQASGR